MPPPSDPDELVSAYLDGEATPEEVALVEADPALRQRVAELRHAADAVGQPTPAPPGAEDRQVERAMVVGTAPQLARPPSGLRRRGTPEQRRTQRWVLAGLSAAAAVGILALAANVIFDEGNPRTNQLAGGEASDQPEEDLFEGGAAPADLGEIDDESELRAQVQDATGLGDDPAESFADEEAPAADETESDAAAGDAAPGTSAAGGELVAPPGGDPEPISQECEIDLVSREPEIAGQLFQATTTYQGEPALVYVYARPDDSPIVFVVERDGCRELTSFPLE